MRIVLLVVSALLWLVLPAYTKSGADCATFQNDGKRLLCYDLLFKTAIIDDSDTPTIGNGDWNVLIEKSKIDDSRKVYLQLQNSELITDRFGTKKNIVLTLACRENTTSLVINFDTFMSSNQGGGRVTFRIDKQKAAKINMTESNGNQALGLWNGSKAIPFIKKMFGKSTLLIRATPFSASSMTPIFKIKGIETSIKPLMEACNWK